MPINSAEFGFIPEASYNGTFPTQGYASSPHPQMYSSTINVNLLCDKDIKFNIFSHASLEDTTGRLVFQKAILANSQYFKRFAVVGMYFSFDITNESSPLTAGNLTLSTSLSEQNQFASQTLLNSSIQIDADTSLVRVGNDFMTDMIRGIHTDFTKVNIQAILNQSAPTTTRTLGCQAYQFNESASADLYIYAPNGNDVPGGTGALTVRVIYVDANDKIQTLDYTLVSPAGSVYPLGVSGKMVHRAFVLTTGTSNSNTGQITITNATQTVIYASIEPTENTSHVGLYLVPTASQLMITTVNIVATGMNGVLRINERDYTNSQLYSIGDFRIDSKSHNYTYNINGKIEAGNAVQIDFIPDAGTPTVQTLINVMVNGILSPLINTFP